MNMVDKPTDNLSLYLVERNAAAEKAKPLGQFSHENRLGNSRAVVEFLTACFCEPSSIIHELDLIFSSCPSAIEGGV